MKVNGLTLVHLSDLHIGHGQASTTIDQRMVLEEIVKDVSELREAIGAPPDYLVISGTPDLLVHGPLSRRKP